MRHKFEPMPDAADYCKCGSYKHNSCHYLEEIPMVERAAGRIIPDLTGIEHVCEWQGHIKPNKH